MASLTIGQGTQVKQYWNVNVSEQTIIEIGEKPIDCRAEEAMARLHQLVTNIIDRKESIPERQLTPGYSIIFIGKKGKSPPPVKDRIGQNLRNQPSINGISKKILDQYAAEYNTKRCYLYKKWDAFLTLLGIETPLVRMARLKKEILDRINTAGQQASDYIDWKYRPTCWERLSWGER